jgi:hypothetical protein
MGKTKNISPDSYQNYQNELIIAKLNKILDNQARMERQQAERFDRIEAFVGMSEHEKNKPIFYTTEEVMKILGLSRNTLLNYRKLGIITPAKFRNTIRYTMDDINKLKAYINKTA